MQSATDKIQVFTPDAIARKIGGDTSDVMGVLNACFLKGSDAAFQWMVQGDYSKPWVFSDSDKRGDALLDMRTTKLCADLHEVAGRPDDHGPMSKADELKILKTVLLDNFPFSRRQFHRDEIARWLVAFGLRSEYEFSQEAEPQAAPVVTEGAARAKPLQRTAAQDDAILCEIKKQGYNPLALPKNPAGKPGVKAAIRAALARDSLFVGSKIFDKAWERLTTQADIVIQD